MADEEVQDPQSDPAGPVGPGEVDDADDAPDAGDEEKSLQDKLKEVIDVQVEEVGSLRKKLTISIPHDAVAEQIDEQYDEMRNEAAVPGFRKGRAPRRLLEKRFGREIGEQLVQQLVSTAYMAAADKTELKVLGDPLIWSTDDEGEMLKEVSEAIATMTLPEGDEPMVYACEVEIRPEFDLPELEGIPLTRPVVTVTDDDISTYLERMRQFRGQYETVTDGSAEADDVIIANVKMTSGETELKEEEAVRVPVRDQVIDGVTLADLGKTLTGAKPGDVKEAGGTIPDDYVKADFRGKQADFAFTVREIQRMVLPELDDAFVKGFGYETEAELREWIKSELESRSEEQVRQGLTVQVYDHLLDKVEMELPERLGQRQEARVLTRRMMDLYRQGVPPAEAEKRMDELKMGAKADAARELKRFFVMEKLAEEFEVDVNEGEINNMIASIAAQQEQRFDRVRDQLAQEGGLMELYVQLRDEKIIQQLIDKAKITEPEPEPEPEEKKTASDADDSGGGK